MRFLRRNVINLGFILIISALYVSCFENGSAIEKNVPSDTLVLKYICVESESTEFNWTVTYSQLNSTSFRVGNFLDINGEPAADNENYTTNRFTRVTTESEGDLFDFENGSHSMWWIFNNSKVNDIIPIYVGELGDTNHSIIEITNRTVKSVEYETFHLVNSSILSDYETEWYYDTESGILVEGCIKKEGITKYLWELASVTGGSIFQKENTTTGTTTTSTPNQPIINGTISETNSINSSDTSTISTTDVGVSNISGYSFGSFGLSTIGSIIYLKFKKRIK